MIAVCWQRRQEALVLKFSCRSSPFFDFPSMLEVVTAFAAVWLSVESDEILDKSSQLAWSADATMGKVRSLLVLSSRSWWMGFALVPYGMETVLVRAVIVK
ncbi:hypothetical protein Tco_0951752 [Tanacetum coccineum]|uniref:Uncharacterized protein n=1 Tax=Tanacetum coccineum TaxID=301880 RepID=A0ABQ5DXE1_9ASTR